MLKYVPFLEGVFLGAQASGRRVLNKIVEQDHWVIKRLTDPMLGFRSFWSAAITFVSTEIMHMIYKGQLCSTEKLCPAQQFYSFAG